MSAGHRYDPAKAERVLGEAAMKAARRNAATAPPLSVELREQIRAVFASARVTRPKAPRPADAA